MTTTIIGLLGDRLGLARHAWLEPGRNIPQLRRRYTAVPGGAYRTRQRRDLDLELDHDRIIGQVRHLERTRDGDLWLVAEVTASPASIPPHAVYLSPSVTYTTEPESSVARDVELVAVSLTAEPATCAARPVHELNGDLRQASRDSWRLRDPFLAGLLDHARDSKVGTACLRDNQPDPTPLGGDLYLDHRGDVIPAGTSARTMRLPDGSYAEMYIRPGRVIAVR